MFSHYEIKYTTSTNVDKTLTINFYPEAGQLEDTQLKNKLREMRAHGLRPTGNRSVYTEE